MQSRIMKKHEKANVSFTNKKVKRQPSRKQSCSEDPLCFLDLRSELRHHYHHGTHGYLQNSNMIKFLRGRERKSDSEFFTRNANKLFAELISASVGIGNINPIHIFSAKELQIATNNYDEGRIIVKDGCYKLYRGFLQNRPISVKRFGPVADSFWDFTVKDVMFSSILSSNKNVLKLLGCCLDTNYPILVFERADKTLADGINLGSDSAHHRQLLPWKCRVKIAVELCDSITYLHNELRNPVIHRNIKNKSILLDEHNAVKLFDFSLSVAIPDGEFQVEDLVRGTIGYLAPEYLATGHFDEKIDVFSVGVVMLQLLTGQRAFDLSRLAADEDMRLGNYVEQHIEENRFNEIVEATIFEERAWPGRDRHLQTFAAIALWCLRDVGERPTITEVARELKEIYLSD